MSESPQPFTDLAMKKKPGAVDSGWGWPVAIVLAVLMAGALYLWLSGRSRQNQQIDSLKAGLEESSTNLANAVAQNQSNQDLITQLKSQVADLEKEKAETVRKAGGLENELRSELESKDVTISKLQGKLTVNILDRVLFDSGEAVLKPGGTGVMKKIADMLAAHPELKIQVNGHTDNVPIHLSARSRFASNWELSVARALAAVHYLAEQAGVDPRRVAAAGYGEYRPVADNATADGRARNRRIAITLLPDEWASGDAAPAARAESNTNSAAVLSSSTP